MEELIKYFENLEARVAAQEERLAAQAIQIAALEAKVEELKNRPEPEPKVVEKIVEKIVEVEKPATVKSSVVSDQPSEEPVIEEPVVEEPIVEEPQPEPVQEEPAKEEPVAEPEPAKEVISPNAALYGKAVDDIRLAISLGDRFLFQRELFSQNAEMMQKTLTELNELSSFDEAVDYISRFGWDTESNTYQQFLVALHRRFG